ncbi:N-6 DNA methylase [bacterium]|nr:N-6 DNA methylase [bacterium]
MAAPDKVLELVERFDRNLEAYKQGKYNETQVRREFIDPLFSELGWDITNKKGYAEAYKEVVHEDAIKVGMATKAPDYSFRIGGARKFFLEAKKPSVNIKEDTHPAYQLRRYAWSAKLPLSILTDFEEFAVYDCRVKPVKTDKSSHSRILYFKYTEYPEHWEKIADIFSREAILKGSFDKYVESKKSKRGTTEVDTAFLQEIERWRELLARNIALRNPALTQQEINFAVCRTIDRIIFLRICEDRGIELYGKLMALQNGTQVYNRLFQLFHQADDRYNSGLFHFRQEAGLFSDIDSLTPGLAIDDKALKDIFKNLYYPDSPYEFSVLPADILGQVYEQFLGKVIRLTPGHRAIVEDKPEIRKAGGIYYTPTYIVDYIVKQTVGRLVEGKKPGPRGAVGTLKILDPACGSGSFLLGAYQFLLDWHRDQYVKDDPDKWAKGRTPRLYQGSGGQWRLTTDERKRILLNNIHGVDIDPQAVEVTKLSLLLKVLEGEDEQTIGHQLSLFQERVLPDLQNNIKCGNSLIGPDFYDNRQIAVIDEEEMYRINTFDWQAEFPEIMAEGGFDAVIGNPPYVRVHRLSVQDKSYFWSHYDTFVAKSDIYGCFVQKGVCLLRAGGRLSFITPNTWTSLESFTCLREFVLRKTVIEQMVRTPKKVFRNVTVRTFIFVLRRITTSSIDSGSKAIIREMTEEGRTRDVGWVSQRDMEVSHLHNLLLHSEKTAPALFTKCMQGGVTVGSAFELRYGFKTADDKRFLATQCLSEFHKPFVRSADISRYLPLFPTGFVDYRPDVMTANRRTARPGDRARFERPKVVVARMGRTLLATFDDTGVFVKDAMLLLSRTNSVERLKMLTGLLNSQLLQYLYQNYFATIDVLKNALLALPLPNHGSDATDKALHDQMVALVEQMLKLNRQLKETNLPQAKTIIQRQIKTTDQQIDKLVYNLYKLTDEEIAIVEEGVK